MVMRRLRRRDVLAFTTTILVILAVSTELLADSCFHICSRSGVESCFVVENCTCRSNKLNSTTLSTNDSKECLLENGMIYNMCGWTNETVLADGECYCFEQSLCNSSGICKNDTCQNGGECLQMDNHTYSCNCTQDFTGLHCELPLDNDNSSCLHVGCHNNGTCIRAGNSSQCKCLEQFNGTLCEDDVCSLCLSNETCIINRTAGGVQCTARQEVSTVTPTSSATFPTTSAASTLPTTSAASAPPTTSAASIPPTTIKMTSLHPTSPSAFRTSVLTSALTSMVTNAASNATTSHPNDPPPSDVGLIVGLTVGIFVLLVLIVLIAVLALHLKKARATSGKYEPSREEKESTTNIYSNILALPPEERLI